MKLALVIALITLVAAPSVNAVTIDLVPIGNPGNAPDTRYGGAYGSVGYSYQIGKYEVTAGQYTEFLNAVAKADPNGLYRDFMVTSQGAQIIRMGFSSNYSYSVAADWAHRPVNWVSFWSAARFTNWLHNGQPSGAQGPATTEGGAYHDVGNQTLFGRNPGARFFIPTEDEWYKAAYHNKAAGQDANYFDYPTGANSLPGRDMAEITNVGNNANYYKNGHLIGSPYYRTAVGEFEMSDSSYGTFDQGGNVWEWNETPQPGDERVNRGGSYEDFISNNMHASVRHDDDPFGVGHDVGFRVAAAAVPEPSAIALAVLSFAAIPIRRPH